MGASFRGVCALFSLRKFPVADACGPCPMRGRKLFTGRTSGFLRNQRAPPFDSRDAGGSDVYPRRPHSLAPSRGNKQPTRRHTAEPALPHEAAAAGDKDALTNAHPNVRRGKGRLIDTSQKTLFQPLLVRILLSSDALCTREKRPYGRDEMCSDSWPNCTVTVNPFVSSQELQ